MRVGVSLPPAPAPFIKPNTWPPPAFHTPEVVAVSLSVELLLAHVAGRPRDLLAERLLEESDQSVENLRRVAAEWFRDQGIAPPTDKGAA